MYKLLLTTIVCALTGSTWLFAQDTFSIVAVDSATGEVGSAGATCLQAPSPPQGALIISDIIPGKGAAHTQASYNQYNQINLRGYLLQGFSPEETLSLVNVDDINSDSTIRQYGVAVFDANGKPQTAAYTGSNCFSYKNHIRGSYYTIQGNILLGQQILDSMQARFLNTSGSLADRLMASMQGANMPGADSRCLNEGVPSQSAFIRVAKPTDTDTALYLHLVVKSRPYGMSPIDSLQTLFNQWKANQPSSTDEIVKPQLTIAPNPALDYFDLICTDNQKKVVTITDQSGRVVFEKSISLRQRINTDEWAKGLYFVRVNGQDLKLVIH